MRFATALTLILATASAARADVVTTTTFESVSIPASGFANDSDPGLTIDGNFFNNNYSVDPVYGPTWSAWAFSNKTDATTAGFGNQYSASTGEGADGSSNYAVAFGDSYINIAPGQSVLSMDVTNTTYAYLSMKNGDTFSKKFGPDDYFILHITGLNGQGDEIGHIDFDLASKGSILNTWDTVDLTSLGAARTLTFSFSSSDNGPFGMNTPAYFALDDFRTFVPSAAVPEPASLAMSTVGLLAVAFAARRGREQTAA